MLLTFFTLLLSPATVQISGTDQVWAFVDYGQAIGASGMLFHQGVRGPEVIVSASLHPSGYTPDYWYVLTRRTDRSPCEYVSPIVANYFHMELGDVLGSGRPQLVMMDLNSDVVIIDPDTRVELGRLALPVTSPLDMALGDSDRDGRIEIHVTNGSTLWVFDGGGVLEWSLQSGHGADLCVAQMDGDAALEIVSLSGRIADGISHQIEWTLPLLPLVGMAAADVDGDGLAEVVVVESSPALHVFDVNLQALLWTRPLQSFEILATGDLDGDARPEILIGERGIADIIGYEGLTGSEVGRVANPGTGVSGILAADVDLDGSIELMWGSVNLQAPGRLFIADWRTAAIEWQNESFEGPFVGPRIGDITGDGLPEVVAATEGGPAVNGRILVFDDKDLDLLAVSDPVTGPGQSDYGLQDVELRDLDQDGTLEILVATGTDREGILLAYKYDSGVFTQVWTNASRPPNTCFMQVDAADLDGDGRMEVIGTAGNVWFHQPDPAVYVYDYLSGQERWHTPPLAGRLELLEGLEVRDLDLDGHLEIVSFARWRSAFIYDPVTRQLELEIPGFHSFMDSYEIAGVPTLMLADDFSQLQFWQYVGGAYQRVRVDSIPMTSRLQVLQRGPGNLTWVGDQELKLMDLRMNAVLWSSSNYGFAGSAVVQPPYSKIEFLMVGRHGMFGFRGR